MDVFRHDYVSKHTKSEASAHPGQMLTHFWLGLRLHARNALE
jgi:hypothetical protein